MNRGQWRATRPAIRLGNSRRPGWSAADPILTRWMLWGVALGLVLGLLLCIAIGDTVVVPR